MERDADWRVFYQAHIISTHTLTWSVTILPLSMYAGSTISTHTLTWSVTETAALNGADNYFNSHAHVERDRRLIWSAG